MEAATAQCVWREASWGGVPRAALERRAKSPEGHFLPQRKVEMRSSKCVSSQRLLWKRHWPVLGAEGFCFRCRVQNTSPFQHSSAEHDEGDRARMLIGMGRSGALRHHQGSTGELCPSGGMLTAPQDSLSSRIRCLKVLSAKGSSASLPKH